MKNSRKPALIRVIFFQAEDGIRDLTVTGVQTCALPICQIAVGRAREVPYPRQRRVPEPHQEPTDRYAKALQRGLSRAQPRTAGIPMGRRSTTRTEERRVGKECRSLCVASNAVDTAVSCQ